MDVVRAQRLCPLNKKRLNATSAMDVVPTTSMDGESNEPFPEAITYDLALSVPFDMGTEVPISNIAGANSRRGFRGDPELFRPTRW